MLENRLEDGCIDVLQKASRGREISLDICNYNVTKRNDLREIAQLLQLDANKLEHLEAAFSPVILPEEVECITHDFGHLGVNSFIVEAFGKQLLIDTGTEPELLQHVKPDAVLITHNHPDHTAGNHFFSPSILYTPDSIKAGKVLQFAELKVQCFDVSGHYNPALAYFLPQLDICFVGDAVFKRSIGGCSGKKNLEKALRNIDLLFQQLNKSTVLCVGHGSQTTVQDELNENPFLSFSGQS